MAKKQKVGEFNPNSKRFCVACEKVRGFRYNRNVGHSECNECGGRIAVDQNNPVLVDLITENTKLKNKLRELRKSFKLIWEEVGILGFKQYKKARMAALSTLGEVKRMGLTKCNNCMADFDDLDPGQKCPYCDGKVEEVVKV